jgi:hypothetical protein
MKIKQKMELPFSDLTTAAYQVWGSEETAKMARLAINARLVVFRDHPHLLISSAKGRHV